MTAILIVDDDEAIRRVLRRILEAQYSVDDASTVAEARQMVDGRHFDLVLCDVTMSPEPGLELVESLADDAPGTVVVMVSALDDPRVAEKALELGVYGYVVKPFTANGIRITVASALRRRALELERILMEEQDRKLRVLADRERIGRDLHENVLQRLFGTGLALQSASRLTSDPDTRQRIDAVVDEQDLTVRWIRSVIFDIESRESSSVRGLVLELIRETTRSLDFEPAVEFIGAVDTLIWGQAADELLATLREALANVVSHAAASHVDVILDVDRDIALTVRDNGVGIDLAEAGWEGPGTASMRARAKRLGGELSVQRLSGGGTQLEWRIPLDNPAPRDVTLA